MVHDSQTGHIAAEHYFGDTKDAFEKKSLAFELTISITLNTEKNFLSLCINEFLLFRKSYLANDDSYVHYFLFARFSVAFLMFRHLRHPQKAVDRHFLFLSATLPLPALLLLTLLRKLVPLSSKAASFS